MNILGIGELEKKDLRFFEIDSKLNIDWFNTAKVRKNRFKYHGILMLWIKLMQNKYDLILTGRIAQRKHHLPIINALSMIWRFIKYPNSFGTYLTMWCKRKTKLIGVNLGDSPIFNAQEYGLFRHCDLYFKRELPQNKLNSFLYINGEFKSRAGIYRTLNAHGGVEKLLPITLGIRDFNDSFRLMDIPKTIDIFFSGAITDHLLARKIGLPQILSLQKAGVNVKVATNRLPKDEFLHNCAASYIVWSPEGNGWDCCRHYEVALAASVPLINYPTIFRYAPFKNGEHALFYGLEDESLKEVIMRELKNKENLIKMGKNAHKFVLQHHTFKAIGSYIIEKSINSKFGDHIT